MRTATRGIRRHLLGEGPGEKVGLMPTGPSEIALSNYEPSASDISENGTPVAESTSAVKGRRSESVSEERTVQSA